MKKREEGKKPPPIVTAPIKEEIKNASPERKPAAKAGAKVEEEPLVIKKKGVKGPPVEEDVSPVKKGAKAAKP